MQRASRAEIEDAFGALPENMQEAFFRRSEWLAAARPKQLPPASGPWLIWVALSGRGFGKTRAGAEWLWWEAFSNPGHRLAVVAPTAGDLRRTIFEGDSGIGACCPHSILKDGSWQKAYNRTHFEVNFANGSIVQGFSADAPDRLRGPQFHGGLCDELAAWEKFDAWDMLQFAVRLGVHTRIVVTTTPKPRQLIRDLVTMSLAGSGEVMLVSGSTFENEANLSPAFLSSIRRKYDGTMLGRQELYAEILSDIDGALWRHAIIDETRVANVPDGTSLSRVVVAIDPAATSTEQSDHTGIIVAALGSDGHYYVLADATMKGHPIEWARRSIDLYHRYRADRIIAETNNGGDMVEAVIRAVDPQVSYKKITASRGKAVRAEPIASLYERRVVHHVGGFADLEDQMCLITPDFDAKEAGFSPDRADALVWALTELSSGPYVPAVPPDVTEGRSLWLGRP